MNKPQQKIHGFYRGLLFSGFGIMCAKTFGNIGGNALVMLASTKVGCRVCVQLILLLALHCAVKAR